MNDIRPLRAACGGPSMPVLWRLDAGDLNDLEAFRHRAHVSNCPECQRALRELRADRATVLERLPFSQLNARMRSRIWGRRATAVVLPVAAAAGWLIFVAPTSQPQAPTPAATVRTKGGAPEPSLDFFVQTPDGAREGHDGEPLGAGDRIRFRYQTGDQPYVLIVGVDADGELFPYLEDGGHSARAEPGRALAPDSVILDEDPRPERVYALYSREPIDITVLKPTARQAVTSLNGHVERLIDLPVDDATQRSLLINKAAR